MRKQVDLKLVGKIRKLRVEQGLGIKAVAKLMPLTKTGKNWDVRQVKRYWTYGIRLGKITEADIARVNERVKKYKSGDTG